MYVFVCVVCVFVCLCAAAAATSATSAASAAPRSPLPLCLPLWLPLPRRPHPLRSSRVSMRLSVRAAGRRVRACARPGIPACLRTCRSPTYSVLDHVSKRFVLGLVFRLYVPRAAHTPTAPALYNKPSVSALTFHHTVSDLPKDFVSKWLGCGGAGGVRPAEKRAHHDGVRPHTVQGDVDTRAVPLPALCRIVSRPRSPLQPSVPIRVALFTPFGEFPRSSPSTLQTRLCPRQRWI